MSLTNRRRHGIILARYFGREEKKNQQSLVKFYIESEGLLSVAPANCSFYFLFCFVFLSSGGRLLLHEKEKLLLPGDLDAVKCFIPTSVALPSIRIPSDEFHTASFSACVREK